METKFKYPENHEILSFVAKHKFRPFTKADWYSFLGGEQHSCTSENPLICETEEYIIIISGCELSVIYCDDEDGGQTYHLNSRIV